MFSTQDVNLSVINFSKSIFFTYFDAVARQNFFRTYNFLI